MYNIVKSYINNNSLSFDLDLILFCIIMGTFLALLVLFTLGITGLVKTSYGLYKGKYKHKTKRRHRPARINLELRLVIYGPYAGRHFLTDTNSFCGVGLHRLGRSRHLQQFQVGNVFVWGILSTTPNLTIGIFRMSRVGVRFVGDDNVTFYGTVLRRVPSYEVIGPFYYRQVELMFPFR